MTVTLPISSQFGSSPLARGTRSVVLCSPVASSAHPRSRGEHSRICSVMSASGGSSPLARGTQFVVQMFNLHDRLIPARAGNTAPGRRPPEARTAHPRSRGEHITNHSFCAPGSGSSPLARGTLNITTFKPLNPRLIPARAGNTRLHLLDKAIYTAHPRSRGEHSPGRGVFGFLGGSSPLARGTRKDSVELRSAARLIPARAGNTRSFWV